MTLMMCLVTMVSCNKECQLEIDLNGNYFCNYCGQDSPYNAINRRVGAQCNNGQYVFTTGSGTCSGKGGVNRWLCQ